MKYELFDPAKHKVEMREIGLAYERGSVREIRLADVKSRHPDAEYPCAMRSLLPGEFEIGWGDKLRVMPEDVAMCVVNGNAIATDDAFPLLFDHAFTARGTERAGAILECYEEGGAFWHIVDLADEDMFKACVKPGKRWKGRSLGFGAWVDGDGYIRPVQPKELSVTNLPRLKGLGNVVEMSHLKKALGIGFGPGPAGLSVPITLAVVPAASPEGTQRAVAGGEGSPSPSSTSPDPASNRKEERMFKVPPKLQKLLGRVEFASEDDFNAAVDALPTDVALAAVPKPEPKVEAKPDPKPEATPALTLAEVKQLFADSTKEMFKELADANAKQLAEAKAEADKKAKIDALIARAVSLGKIPKADAEFMRPSIEKDPAAFEQRLSTMKTVAPVERFYEAGGTPKGPEGEFHGFDTPQSYTHEIANVVAVLGCSVSQAIQVVNAGGLDAGEEN